MEISVIIPSYQPQDYIYCCLESIYNQNLVHSAFEVIIVLNGPRDPFYGYLKRILTENFSTLNAQIAHTDFASVSHARNVGISLSSGRFIAFVDDDDAVSPNYLNELYTIALHGRMPISNIRSFIDFPSQSRPFYMTEVFEPRKGDVVDILDVRSFFSTVCCKLIDVDVIGNRRFNVKYRNGEDSLFMAEISDTIDQIQLTSSNCIYYRRIRPNSAVTRSRSTQDRVLSSLRLTFSFISVYFKNPKGYNFLFFVTRVFAPFKSIYLRICSFNVFKGI